MEKYRCSFCKKEFTDRAEFRSHVLLDHTDEGSEPEIVMSLVDADILEKDLQNNTITEETFTRSNKFKLLIKLLK